MMCFTRILSIQTVSKKYKHLGTNGKCMLSDAYKYFLFLPKMKPINTVLNHAANGEDLIKFDFDTNIYVASLNKLNAYPRGCKYISDGSILNDVISEINSICNCHLD